MSHKTRALREEQFAKQTQIPSRYESPVQPKPREEAWRKFKADGTRYEPLSKQPYVSHATDAAILWFRKFTADFPCWTENRKVTK